MEKRTLTREQQLDILVFDAAMYLADIENVPAGRLLKWRDEWMKQVAYAMRETLYTVSYLDGIRVLYANRPLYAVEVFAPHVFGDEAEAIREFQAHVSISRYIPPERFFDEVERVKEQEQCEQYLERMARLLMGLVVQMTPTMISELEQAIKVAREKH